jgi:tetratricopeptide (TPR) repeat protein
MLIPAAAALALHVKALQKIGNVREDQGKLPAAMEAYRAAAAAGAELMRRAPGDVEREAAYAETLHHLGNAYWFQGDLNRALECFQQAIALLQRAVTLRPTDTGLSPMPTRINVPCNGNGGTHKINKVSDTIHLRYQRELHVHKFSVHSG